MFTCNARPIVDPRHSLWTGLATEAAGYEDSQGIAQSRTGADSDSSAREKESWRSSSFFAGELTTEADRIDND